MAKTTTKDRLRAYFERNSKALTVATITQYFDDVPVATLNYNLTSLLKEGAIVRRKRGVYQTNASYQSPEDKRKTVDDHIKANGSRIRSGAPWRPGLEPLTESVNPILHSFLGRTFGESIVERMKAAAFTDADVRFVEDLLARVYPVPEGAQG